MAVTVGDRDVRPDLRRRTSRRVPPATAGELIAAPPKLRRRPLLVAGSVAAVCLGALLAGWAYVSSTTAEEVVAVRASVARGEVITRADLVTVRVGVDPGLHPVPAGQLDSVVGQRAAMDLPAGGLLTPDAVASSVLPARGLSVVGVALPPSLLPGEPLHVGDLVRVVATPGQQGEVAPGVQRFIAATVVGVYPDAENGSSVVSVQVPYGQAGELAARAATGKVALVLDSRER